MPFAEARDQRGRQADGAPRPPRRAAEQQAGREAEVDRLLLVHAEREQDGGGRAHVGDRTARGDRDQRGRGGEAEDDEGERRREADTERGQEQRAPERP